MAMNMKKKQNSLIKWINKMGQEEYIKGLEEKIKEHEKAIENIRKEIRERRRQGKWYGRFD